jgi:UDP-glucose 4-epimerase
MRVLVTGGAGGLGATVCRKLAHERFQVRVLDLDTPRNRESVKEMADGVEVVWGDITQPDSVRRATQGVDAVVHLAGLLPPLTEQKPELARRVNVGGTQTLLNVTRERGERIPFVFTSSASVFGECPDVTECLHPDRNPCHPTTVYAETKVQAEDLIRESGMDYVILRLTSVPYLRPSLAGMRTQMFSVPLKNRVEFCHPDDLALAIRNAVMNFDMVKGKTLMIAGGPSQQMLFEDMLGAVLGTFGLPLPPQDRFSKEPYPLHWYDTSDSQNLLAYQTKTLDDYCTDLARQKPATLVAAPMRHLVGPVFGRLIVLLL